MNKILLCIKIIILFFAFTYSQTFDEVKSLSIEELLNINVTTASGIEEKLINAPSSIIVITSEEIQKRGYSSLDEVLFDLPGFDVIKPNGDVYISAYQRGYRTAGTQRTLLMINGKVDNSLWTHEAHISRQYPISGIKRIEILYGPASAVYGPNAFLGIINIITKDGSEIENGKIVTDVNFQVGSFNSRNIDITTRGKINNVAISLSGRMFKSDEPDLSGRWGFLSNKKLSNQKIWGPILDINYAGKKFGSYYDPTDNYGLIGTIKYNDYTFGFINGLKREGYGAQFAADRGQPNSFWNYYSMQLFLENKSKLSEQLKINTLVLYRESRIFGDWAEAVPDWDDTIVDDFQNFSWVSFTQWSTFNYSWLVKQNFEYNLSKDFLFSGGLKFEKKELTKAYDIPGYWDAYSSAFLDGKGKYGYGLGILHSSENEYNFSSSPANYMPNDNITITEDFGGYFQSIYDYKKYRINFGIRFDKNSLYGSSVNPRISFMYRLGKHNNIKLFYGEAFQEPAPIVLFGGWNGREANPDLKPEKARNFEVIFMYQTGKLFHDLSVYSAHYQNVIKEEAENAGNRSVFGIEYRMKFDIPNFIKNSKEISGYIYYSYIDVTSSIRFNHITEKWENGETELGDMAPHKINFGVNIPIKDNLNFNFRSNYVSERLVYSRNPLRINNYKVGAYFVCNLALSYSISPVYLTLKVLNLFDENYYHPGIENADSGDDFTKRSQGFSNSLLPQQERSLWVNFKISL